MKQLITIIRIVIRGGLSLLILLVSGIINISSKLVSAKFMSQLQYTYPLKKWADRQVTNPSQSRSLILSKGFAK